MPARQARPSATPRRSSFCTSKNMRRDFGLSRRFSGGASGSSLPSQSRFRALTRGRSIFPCELENRSLIQTDRRFEMPDMNGTEPKIEIFKPFEEAFELTKKILFRPFDITKWFVIGFAAFLANLAGGVHFGNFN